MHGVALQQQGRSVSSTSRKTSFSSSLIVERWRAEHQLQFPSSTLHVQLGVTQVCQIWQTRGGHKTVTKANNRKHKTRTAKTLGVEPFSVGKTKQAKVSLAANNRSPCHRTSHSAVLYILLSPTLLTCHRSQK